MGSWFKCFFCLEHFSDLQVLQDHTSKHVCGENVVEKFIPKGKRTLQVDISFLKCRICNKEYTNLDHIRKHLNLEHKIYFYFASNGMTEFKLNKKEGFLRCHICDERFPTFSGLNTHMNCHVSKVVCENCGAGFLNQHLLLKHKETHLLMQFKCKDCEKLFVKKSQLKYHNEIIHKDKGRIKVKTCPYCSETFKEHYTKNIHLRNKHGITNIFPCHLCEQQFSSRRSLTEHTTKNHSEKYKCIVCTKCFSIKSKLNQHMRGHTGERNFICPVCKNAYMHKITLHKHIKNHNLLFKFLCFECGSGFDTKCDFTKHKQLHLNDMK